MNIEDFRKMFSLSTQQEEAVAAADSTEHAKDVSLVGPWPPDEGTLSFMAGYLPKIRVDNKLLGVMKRRHSSRYRLETIKMGEWSYIIGVFPRFGIASKSNMRLDACDSGYLEWVLVEEQDFPAFIKQHVTAVLVRRGVRSLGQEQAL